MKRTDLEKLKGKKIAAGVGNGRGGQGEALGKREQAMERKRALLERLQKGRAGDKR